MSLNYRSINPIFICDVLTDFDDLLTLAQFSNTFGILNSHVTNIYVLETEDLELKTKNS